VFDNCGVGKKKSITDPVSIIPFKNQSEKSDHKSNKHQVTPTISTPLQTIEAPVSITSPPVGKLTLKRLSITGPKQHATSEGEKLIVPGGTVLENPYDKDDLMIAWRKAAHRLNESNHLLKMAMIDHDLIAFEKDYFHFKFANQAILDRFNNEKHDILFYLREQLKNKHIQIEALLMEQTGITAIRNSKAIFQEMIQSNPSLSSLQKMFGLELDS
jgi:hypothetical protein